MNETGPVVIMLNRRSSIPYCSMQSQSLLLITIVHKHVWQSVSSELAQLTFKIYLHLLLNNVGEMYHMIQKSITHYREHVSRGLSPVSEQNKV